MDLVYHDPESLMRSIQDLDVYIVKKFYARDKILKFREFLADISRASEPSWHPCLNGCPDYHRINDEYPKSYVKGKVHQYFFHRWNEHKDVFDEFKEIFEIKNSLAGADQDDYYDNVPSQGIISRIVAHQYPRGGGYLEEHIDPISSFALIQTIIQASDYECDFETGGLFVRETSDQEPLMIDQYSEMGDLMVLTPYARHGVAPIDPERKLDWTAADGRWMILPVVIRSDYAVDLETKPKAVARVRQE